MRTLFIRTLRSPHLRPHHPGGWAARVMVALGAVGLLSLSPRTLSARTTAVTDSTFFSTVSIEDAPSIGTKSDGDLWPSCWAKDGALVTANGDGAGFAMDGSHPDIVVNRIEGDIPNLTGRAMAHGDAVGSIWTPGGKYNRKPTGMVSVDGVLYLAIQDLRVDFNDAPAASISKSTDGGRTWAWDKTKPMFRDYAFTTIVFLDYGRDFENAPDGFVYAYGLDNNWRDSFNDRVPDPTALYLARVPKEKVQDRSAWEFFAGTDASGAPRWENDIKARKPVLEDARRVYPVTYAMQAAHNMSVLSQGGIVYNKPLRRYIYTSWTEFTFEFYESPTPWGPWRLFLHKDFGEYPWTAGKLGGYGVTAPSRFISADGKTMYLQDNTFVGGVMNYRYSLRKMVLEPYAPGEAANERDGAANLAREKGTVPIAKTFHFGSPQFLSDGIHSHSEDDWDQEKKPLSWWGYTWSRPYRMNKVIFTSGAVYPDGGWFRETPRVQVRKDFRWVDVKGVSVAPAYPGDETAGPNKTFTFRFPEATGTGIRIIGAPGGAKTFTSISDLGVFYE